jgi:hypothetical protein
LALSLIVIVFAAENKKVPWLWKINKLITPQLNDANGGDNSIAVIDPKTKTITVTIAVGEETCSHQRK